MRENETKLTTDVRAPQVPTWDGGEYLEFSGSVFGGALAGQSHLGSWLEAWANIAIGFAINWSANLLILPLFGWHVTPASAFNLGLIFTAISLVRSYVLRRVFNGIKRLHHADEHPRTKPYPVKVSQK